MEIVSTALGIDPGLQYTGMACIHRLADGSLKSGGVRLSETKPDKTKTHARVSSDTVRRLRLHSDAFNQAIRDARPKVIGIESYQIYDSRDVQKLQAVTRRLMSLFGLTGNSKLLPFRSAEELLGAFTARDSDLFERFLANLLDIRKALEHEDSFVGARGRGNAAKTMLVYGAAMTAGFNAGLPVFLHSPAELKVKITTKKSASKQDVADALSRKIEGLEDDVTAKIRAKTKHEHVYDAAGHALLALQVYEEFVGTQRLAC